MTVPLLSVQGLTLQRGRDQILRSVDFSLYRGELVALIGPNGAGKTSLLRTISTHLRADSGSCHISEMDARSDPIPYRQSFGAALAPEELPADLTPRQMLQITAAARGIERIPEEVLELAARLGLQAWLDRAMGACSLGARQKTGLLVALVGRPPLLLFDEPFNGLDPLAAFEFKACLRQWTQSGQCSVLLATHGLEVAERLLDRAALLLNGRIVEHWTRSQLSELRAQGVGLELAMVERMRSNN